MPSPLPIGILNDTANGPSDPTVPDLERWLRLVADEYVASGRLDREVEFINAWGLGLPGGSAAAVERAYETLAARNVLMIVGPAIGDNALIAQPLTERFRIPTINWAGTEKARSDYMFHLQIGSHEDESIVLVRHLAASGVLRVGIVYDDSPIGSRHLEFFKIEADIVGLGIASAAMVAPLAENADAQVTGVLRDDIEALVYLGLGISAPAVARAAKQQNFNGIRVMNTAGIRGYDPEYASAVDGWVYIDMHSSGNTTLAAFCERITPAVTNRLAAAKGYDLGRLVAEGLARASEWTHKGIRNGLEKIKWLPAALGHDGTQLSFGNFDRGALHGRYLVLRQWRDQQSIEIA